MAELIISPKDDNSVTMTIRISKKLQEQYNSLAKQTNISRNKLISIALQYAVDNMRVEEK
ncbi:MAG: CopG family transcriptional regulator [Lachnospiraceae bacterium]|nr:CopG family transcriptional regulator [Lachnospiraceae bacterium]